MTMRLSNGNVNTRASLSPFKSARPSTCAENLLREDGSGWPPLLATFAEANDAAVASFVNMFITRRIQFKCGQCQEEQFISDFLTPWLTQARARVVAMDGLVASAATSLTASQRSLYEGCVQRLLSAIRDAQTEMPATHRAHDKAISFARPIAHRIVRHSSDRFSLRSVTDDDRSEFSLTPPPPAHSRVSTTGEKDENEDDDDTGDSGAYTARTSGIYYGDVVHAGATRYSAEQTSFSDGENETQPAPRESLFATDPLHCLASPEVQRAAHRRARKSTLRGWWLLLFYALPAAIVAVLVLLYWFPMPSPSD